MHGCSPGKGVTVCSLSPGFTYTGLFRHSLSSYAWLKKIAFLPIAFFFMRSTLQVCYLHLFLSPFSCSVCFFLGTLFSRKLYLKNFNSIQYIISVLCRYLIDFNSISYSLCSSRILLKHRGIYQCFSCYFRKGT